MGRRIDVHFDFFFSSSSSSPLSNDVPSIGHCARKSGTAHGANWICGVFPTFYTRIMTCHSAVWRMLVRRFTKYIYIFILFFCPHTHTHTHTHMIYLPTYLCTYYVREYCNNMFCPLTSQPILPHARLSRHPVSNRSRSKETRRIRRWACVCACVSVRERCANNKRINVNKPVQGMRTIFKYTPYTYAHIYIYIYCNASI